MMEDRYRLTEYVMQIKHLEQERDYYGRVVELACFILQEILGEVEWDIKKELLGMVTKNKPLDLSLVNEFLKKHLPQRFGKED